MGYLRASFPPTKKVTSKPRRPCDNADGCDPAARPLLKRTALFCIFSTEKEICNLPRDRS
jgi:hypothetical protein